jgi:uncharacterized membrane protein
VSQGDRVLAQKIRDNGGYLDQGGLNGVLLEVRCPNRGELSILSQLRCGCGPNKSGKPGRASATTASVELQRASRFLGSFGGECRGRPCFTIIPAIVFLLVEPYNRNRFVRFHSFQCLFVAVALVIVDIALSIISAIFHLVPVIGWFVAALMWPLYGLAVLALWILLVIKAYQHQIYKLPVLGDMAEKQAGA